MSPRITRPKTKTKTVAFRDINKGTVCYWSNDPRYNPPETDSIWAWRPKRKKD